MVNKLIIFLMALMASFTFTALADGDVPNGDNASAHIDISTVAHPKPHFADVTPPIAMYNTVTEELSVTLDPVHYSDYTITLVSGLIEVDYYPFSSVVRLPTASMGDVVTNTSCLF